MAGDQFRSWLCERPDGLSFLSPPPSSSVSSPVTPELTCPLQAGPAAIKRTLKLRLTPEMIGSVSSFGHAADWQSLE